VHLDVTENLQNIPLARDVALAIRAKIKAETGLSASAGISYNKFLAKLASDHRKPNGQYVITPEMGPAFVKAMPLGRFHGIGPAIDIWKSDVFGPGLDFGNPPGMNRRAAPNFTDGVLLSCFSQF
jgi:hypothetical protein